MRSLVCTLSLFVLMLAASASAEQAAYVGDEWASLYFNQPRTHEQHDNFLRTRFSYFIQLAQRTVDVSAYDIDDAAVKDALLAAHNRGVRVRIVTDASNRANQPLAELVRAGIQVVDETFDGGRDDAEECHNKFFVVDNEYVWTGSLNVTTNGFDRHEENVIILHAPAIAAEYTKEFEEMWGGNGDRPDPAKAKLGKDKTDNTNRDITLMGVPGSLLFTPTPNVDIEGYIIREIAAAKQRIYFAIFTFTSRRIQQALIQAAERGVQIRGVYDQRQAAQASSTFGLVSSSMPGIQAMPSHGGGVIHHKLMVIDPPVLGAETGGNPSLIIGSYNWTKKAYEANDENILILHNRELVLDAFHNLTSRWGE